MDYLLCAQKEEYLILKLMIYEELKKFYSYLHFQSSRYFIASFSNEKVFYQTLNGSHNASDLVSGKHSTNV